MALMKTTYETYPCRPAIELAVVIPTYNERENISPLFAALETTLRGFEWEIIVVDDNSPDGTADYIRGIAKEDRRIRVLERVGRRGLSSACIEGMLATSARYIAVMDGDLQHDESILPKMLELAKWDHLDVVIASRKVAGGSISEMSRYRRLLSNLGDYISRYICRCDVSDPMSGYFIVDRLYFRRTVHLLAGAGFKILVDLLASSPGPVRIGEVPYHFRKRQHGESKLDLRVELEYLYLLVDKCLGRKVPTRFVIFVVVGALGLFLHLAVLAVLYYRAHAKFIVAQALATLVSMTVNYYLNNAITFRDRSLRGWRLTIGLLAFYLACSLGALINLSFAGLLLLSHVPWYVAGIAGMAVSSVWNYGVTMIIIWHERRV
jgi:dolichol-phosphate mannosyltransferase